MSSNISPDLDIPRGGIRYVTYAGAEEYFRDARDTGSAFTWQIRCILHNHFDAENGSQRASDPAEVPVPSRLQLETLGRESTCLERIVHVVLDREAGTLGKICAYVCVFFIYITYFGISSYVRECEKQTREATDFPNVAARFVEQTQRNIHLANVVNELLRQRDTNSLAAIQVHAAKLPERELVAFTNEMADSGRIPEIPASVQ